MSKNIFEIWKDNGEKLPFAVRRDNWSSEYASIVEEIEIRKWPYGIARGYATRNGKRSNHYSYSAEWRKDRQIPCAGCYQWTLVENQGEGKINQP